MAKRTVTATPADHHGGLGAQPIPQDRLGAVARRRGAGHRARDRADVRVRPGLARRLASEHWPLLIVGAAYLVAEVATSRLTADYAYDETVYLSQIAPGHPATFFTPHRARGLMLLLAPVGPFATTVGAVRLYLAVFSAAGLVWAFGLWGRVVGVRAATLAAAAFGFSWLAVFYGPLVYPQMAETLLAVAAVGCLARHITGAGGRAALWGGGVALALATAIRPWDGALIGAGLGIGALAAPGGRLRRAATVATAVIAGWIPWIIESFLRFGGPVARFESASRLHVASEGTGFQLLEYVGASSRGPGGAPGGPSPPPWPAVAWWVAMAVLLLAGLASVRRGPRLAALGGCAAAGVLLALFYFVVPPFASVRFAIPALALVSMPAGVGLAALVARRRAATVIALAIMAPWGAWQLAMAHRMDAALRDLAGTRRVVGQELGRIADGRSCEFVGPSSGPQIQFWSGCVWRGSAAPSPGWAGPAPPGRARFLVLGQPRAARSPTGGHLVWSRAAGDRVWSIYELVQG